MFSMTKQHTRSKHKGKSAYHSTTAAACQQWSPQSNASPITTGCT